MRFLTMAEEMLGIQRFVKFDYMDESYPKAAIIMLKRAFDYEAGVILKKSWNCIVELVGDTSNMKVVQQIIDEAYESYLKELKANKIDEREKALVEKQVKYYNLMLQHAYREAKERGLIVSEEGIGYKNFHQSKKSTLNQEQLRSFDEEELELK